MKKTIIDIIKKFWDIFKPKALPIIKTAAKAVALVAAGAIASAIGIVCSPAAGAFVVGIFKLLGIDVQ